VKRFSRGVSSALVLLMTFAAALSVSGATGASLKKPTYAAGDQWVYVLEGSLTISTKRCGRPTCRCATEGPLHETALLTWKEQQKTCTLHIPIALREEVAAWVAECQRLKALIHTMSAAQRAFLIAQRRRAR